MTDDLSHIELEFSPGAFHLEMYPASVYWVIEAKRRRGTGPLRPVRWWFHRKSTASHQFLCFVRSIVFHEGDEMLTLHADDDFHGQAPHNVAYKQL